MRYEVILKSLTNPEQIIVLASCPTQETAVSSQKSWRAALGAKKWNVNRRPGLDTLGDLALTVRTVQHAS